LIDAVILDMDGVMIDSELQWKLSEGPFFRDLVPAWRDEHHERIVGLSPLDLYEFLRDEYGLSRTREQFLGLCDELARDIYGKRVTLAPGLAGFIERVRAGGLPLGIASSSPRPWIELVLRRFDLGAHFRAIASGDETPGRTKPNPDLYHLAAQRLGHREARCLAVEDSFVGVRAAKKAGLLCAAYRNGHNHSQDLSAADLSFDDFAAFDYAAAISRLKRD
jgi:HAD superfamily hydrolase (TIGR01509 family)